MSTTGTLSPLTGVIQERDVIIDFGQFEGQSVGEIRELDPEFYQQLIQAKQADTLAIRRNRDKTFRLYMNPLARMSS